MRKMTKVSNKDLMFVQKYCLADTFPASDERCPYAKAKLLAGFPEVRKVKAISGKQMQCFSVDTQIKRCLHTKRA